MPHRAEYLSESCLKGASRLQLEDTSSTATVSCYVKSKVKISACKIWDLGSRLKKYRFIFFEMITAGVPQTRDDSLDDLPCQWQ